VDVAPVLPSYIRLLQTGELARRADALEALLAACTVCPHDCGNNRLQGELARCYTAYNPVVSSFTAHFGEEPLLTGTQGVGNIFFGNCNLRCVYCQNHEISQNHREENRHAVTVERLAEIMLELQSRGCHSIGLVSPTHVVPQIVRALVLAADQGLSLPLIYNTNAYDSIEVLRLLEGVVDIYLPDLKYDDAEMGYRYSGVKDYPRFARAALEEMHRQVGSDLVIGEDGLVKRGLIIRHLVLPNDIAGSRETMQWIHDTLGPQTTISVMSQYFPTHKALITPLLDRKIRESEFERVLRVLDRLGMEHGWVQEYEASEYYRPEFARRDAPFTGGADNSDA
jgi:putative pyruvate formate lyase activating enzyme